VAFIIDTSDARPEHVSRPARPTSRHARPCCHAHQPSRDHRHVGSSLPLSTRKDDVRNEISVCQAAQRFDDAQGVKFLGGMLIDDWIDFLVGTRPIWAGQPVKAGLFILSVSRASAYRSIKWPLIIIVISTLVVVVAETAAHTCSPALK
jgi:hypothetical protein